MRKLFWYIGTCIHLMNRGIIGHAWKEPSRPERNSSQQYQDGWNAALSYAQENCDSIYKTVTPEKLQELKIFS